MPIGLVTSATALPYIAAKPASDAREAAPVSAPEPAMPSISDTTSTVDNRIIFSQQVGHYITQTVNVDTGAVVSQTPSEGILRMQELLHAWADTPKGGTTVDTTT